MSHLPNIPDQALEHALVFSGPVTYYAINDHLGTPQLFVDDAGAVVWQAEYEPFGKVNLTLSEAENNIRFPGQYHDSETGLHYNWHRYYDPALGRYISADPIGLDGGINLYAYVAGNPVNWVDFMGLKEWTILDIPDERDLLNFIDTTWCKNRQRTWKKGFQKCLDQFEEDLAKCANDPCPNQCKEKTKQKFRQCIKQNNDDNGVTYPNSRCYWKEYGDYYRGEYYK